MKNSCAAARKGNFPSINMSIHIAPFSKDSDMRCDESAESRCSKKVVVWSESCNKGTPMVTHMRGGRPVQNNAAMRFKVQ